MPTLKRVGDAIQVWDGFSMHGMETLHRIHSIMDQYVYKDIIKNVLLPYTEDFLPVIWIFVQDCNPKHMAKSVQKLLEKKQVQILDWLAQSPDLNPLEHVWGQMGRALNNQKFKNLDELYTNLQKFWYEFPLKKCKKYIGSMHQRCIEFIKKKSYHS